MSDEATLAKIRRLLRLGNSPNEHEARLALAKAAELARRASIDLGCVQAEEERERIAEKEFQSRRVFNVVDEAAMELCVGLFGVRCVFGLRTGSYIGLPHNIEAAHFAHIFIVEQCGRDLRAYKKTRATIRKNLSKAATYQFCQGWTYGVRNKYKAELAAVEPAAAVEDSKTAIVLRSQEKELGDYMQSKHSDVKESKPPRSKKIDGGALLAGFRAGSKATISRPLSDAPAPRFALESEVAA